MNKRLMVSVATGALMAAMLPAVASANFGNGPASAGIVERFEQPGIGIWIDETDELVVLANVASVRDACEDRPAGAGDVQVLTLPNGVIITVLHDNDVPVLVVPLAPPEVDPCADPDNYRVIATGTGNVRGTDNDANVSLTRNNTFGNRLSGRVVDDSGQAWSVQAVFRARVTQDDEFKLIREDVNLVKRGRK